MAEAIISRRGNGNTTGNLVTEIFVSNKDWIVPIAKNNQFSVTIFGGGGGSSLQIDIHSTWTSSYGNITTCAFNGLGGGGGWMNTGDIELQQGNIVKISIGTGGRGASVNNLITLPIDQINRNTKIVGESGGTTSFGPYLSANGGEGADLYNGGNGGAGGGGGVGGYIDSRGGTGFQFGGGGGIWGHGGDGGQYGGGGGGGIGGNGGTYGGGGGSSSAGNYNSSGKYYTSIPGGDGGTYGGGGGYQVGFMRNISMRGIYYGRGGTYGGNGAAYGGNPSPSNPNTGNTRTQTNGTNTIGWINTLKDLNNEYLTGYGKSGTGGLTSMLLPGGGGFGGNGGSVLKGSYHIIQGIAGGGGYCGDGGNIYRNNASTGWSASGGGGFGGNGGVSMGEGSTGGGGYFSDGGNTYYANSYDTDGIITSVSSGGGGYINARGGNGIISIYNRGYDYSSDDIIFYATSLCGGGGGYGKGGDGGSDGDYGAGGGGGGNGGNGICIIRYYR